MNPVKVVLPPSSTGPSAPVALDWLQRPFAATVQVYTSGAASYGLQYTLDDIMNTPPGNVRWVDTVEIPSTTTTSATGKLTSPCTAVRLNVASNAAALEWRVLQG